MPSAILWLSFSTRKHSISFCMKSEAFMVVKISVLFSGFSLIVAYRHFAGPVCPHHDRNESSARTMGASDALEALATYL